MKPLVLLLLMLVFSSIYTHARAQTVSKVTVYKKFMRAGTTVGLYAAFKNPKSYNSLIDTVDINGTNLVSSKDFTQLLASAKRKRHFQQKLTGYDFVGEMVIESKKHFYLYFSQNLLIDLTARIEYRFAAASSKSVDEKMQHLSTNSK